MSSKSRNTLRCGHYVSYEDVPPRKGDLVYCPGCKNYQLVTEVDMLREPLPAWTWVCQTPHAKKKLEKKFLGKRLDCEKSAIAHAKRCHHTVVMYAPSGDVHHVYRDHDPNQLSLFVTPDGPSGEIPF